MSIRITAATTARILRQLVTDRRTVALILLVPALLLTLLRHVMDSDPAVFDRVGLVMLGVFPFISMFLVTSVAMLRERTGGTLERMLTTPLNKLDLLLGYGIAFAVAAGVQAAIAATVAYRLLGLDTAGSPWLIGALAVANAVLGVAVGLFLSAFATSEFQAVQFMPAVVLPQLLLCGLIWPRDEMAGWLQGASEVMPLTYAVEALTEVGANTGMTRTLWVDLAVVLGVALLALVLGAATLRRRTD
ncbi:ABC transporter permease [Phytomonospora sp. NPDC050363]|uniref:ABC transporter permease n=1 Tax=Phytomonospora sp. NPDC050363 TaxID=3155642 RepID=UPI0033E86215